jgi:hypothetical protein
VKHTPLPGGGGAGRAPRQDRSGNYAAPIPHNDGKKVYREGFPDLLKCGYQNIDLVQYSYGSQYA